MKVVKSEKNVSQTKFVYVWVRLTIRIADKSLLGVCIIHSVIMTLRIKRTLTKRSRFDQEVQLSRACAIGRPCDFDLECSRAKSSTSWFSPHATFICAFKAAAESRLRGFQLSCIEAWSFFVRLLITFKLHLFAYYKTWSIMQQWKQNLNEISSDSLRMLGNM